MLPVYDRPLFELGFVDHGINDTCATEKGIAALKEYDAAQAAKRAAEVEAAYTEGYHDHDWLLTSDQAWAASQAKKSLETIR
jgi:hypothetical protein